MSPALWSLLVLGAVAVLYATELVPLGLAAVLGCVLMVLVGAADFATAFRGFADPVVFLVGGMMVVGEALFATGAARDIGDRLAKLARGDERKLVLLVVLAAAALSAFLNNTGTTAVFLPIVSGLALASPGRIRVANVLMFVAFAANTGGMLTLVGSTPPLLAQAALRNAGFRPFGFFEFALIGLPILAAYLAYVTFFAYPLARRRFAALPAAPALQANAAHNAAPPFKKYAALGVLLLCVALFAAEPIPLALTAILGALLVLLLGCCPARELFSRFDWNTIFLLAGALGMAAALDKSGGGKLVADWALGLLGPRLSPWTFLAVVSAVGILLTQFMSNTATMAMLTPIALSMCRTLNVAPHPVLMALATVTAAAYATPVGTPPNSLVLVAGYRFRDYLLLGGIFNVLVYVLVVLLVPLIWPF
ncbi:MAG: SLC13 family permease [Candidatus Bipolaricaulota bacterium]|nr:SLC13 family permease [Candidatus Bipolaricaulota bacterium]MCX7844827.1 SLC13 family permease [Candidatus Bipolaricaulota bacterium]MDW8151786.1 SLC13 family permease [Candidatus Bipolaricaulota bacterium]